MHLRVGEVDGHEMAALQKLNFSNSNHSELFYLIIPHLINALAVDTPSMAPLSCLDILGAVFAMVFELERYDGYKIAISQKLKISVKQSHHKNCLSFFVARYFWAEV